MKASASARAGKSKASWWSRFRKKTTLTDSLHSSNPLSHHDLNAAARSLSAAPSLASKTSISPQPECQSQLGSSARVRTNSAADLAARPNCVDLRRSPRGDENSKPPVLPPQNCPKSPADHRIIDHMGLSQRGGGKLIALGSDAISDNMRRRGSDACEHYRRFG